jgi:hypothetical protein
MIRVEFRGYVYLMAQAGVARVACEVVHKDDDFTSDAISGVCSHVPNYRIERDDPAEWIGVYAVAIMGDGSQVLEWCTPAYVADCRDIAREKDVWQAWPMKMWRKTAIKSLARSGKIDTTQAPGLRSLVKMESESGESAGEVGGAVPETSSADAPSLGMAGLVAATKPEVIALDLGLEPDRQVMAKIEPDGTVVVDPVEAALPSPEPTDMPPEIGDPITRTEMPEMTVVGRIPPDVTVESVVVRKGPPPEAAVGDTDPEDPDYNHEGLSPEDKAEREAVEAQAKEDADEMAKEAIIAGEYANSDAAQEKKRLADEADQRRFEGRATPEDKEKSAVDYMAEAGMPDERNWADGRAYAHLINEKTKTSELGRSKNRKGVPGTFTYDRTPKGAAVGDQIQTEHGHHRVAVPHPTEKDRVAWLACNDEGHVIGKAGAGQAPITPAAAKAVSELPDPFPTKAEPTPIEQFKTELAEITRSSALVPLVKAWEDRVAAFDEAERQEFRDVFSVKQTELHEAKKAEREAMRAEASA